jgi:hypothetical protein
MPRCRSTCHLASALHITQKLHLSAEHRSKPFGTPFEEAVYDCPGVHLNRKPLLGISFVLRLDLGACFHSALIVPVVCRERWNVVQVDVDYRSGARVRLPIGYGQKAEGGKHRFRLLSVLLPCVCRCASGCSPGSSGNAVSLTLLAFGWSWPPPGAIPGLLSCAVATALSTATTVRRTVTSAGRGSARADVVPKR